MKRELRKIWMSAVLLAALAILGSGPALAGSGYVQKNLVSNDTSRIPAAHEDVTLLNPWGIAFFPSGPFWVNDNGSGLSALYDGTGMGFGGTNPALAVTIPPPKGSSATATPTGIVANTSFGFALKAPNSSPALFIFDTEDGTISAWNLGLGIPATAELEVDNSTKLCANGATGSVYKGLATGVAGGAVFLYATNFRCGTVDVFDSHFKPFKFSAGFSDPNIPDGFAPFGIANIRGNLVVTYAKQDPQKHDDVKGPGNGFVDVFRTDGRLIERFASRGVLNSPWGVTEAPFNFGRFSNDVLIGNFGNGWINAFSSNRSFDGTLRDPSNKPIAIDGLWSIVFGGAAASSPSALYFTSGPNDEADGLVGRLLPN